MKTAVLFNTFSKMRHYDIDDLNFPNTQLIAVIGQNEVEAFKHYFDDVFDEIVSVNVESDGNLDIKACAALLERLLPNPDLRLISQSEDNLLLVAKLRDQFQIPGPSYNETLGFRDKLVMKDRIKLAGLLTPEYRPLSAYAELVEQVGFPLIIKPTTQACSRGVSLIRNTAELDFFLEKIGSKQSDYEIEQFISGQMFHFDSITDKGEVLFETCSQYNIPNMEFAQGIPLFTIPLKRTDSLFFKAKAYHQAVLLALGHTSSATHLEFFLNNKDEIVFLEIAARTAGAIVPNLYEEAYGINILNLELRRQLNFTIPKPNYEKRPFVSKGFCPTKAGYVSARNNLETNSENELNWLINEGDYIPEAQSLRDIACTVTLRNKSYTELKKDFHKMKEFQCVQVAN